jgi:thioredoxin-like negative regulator of GroEL
MAENGVRIDRVINAGGIPQSGDTLNRVYANVLNKPVLVPAGDVTSLGSAIFAFLAAGTFNTIEDAQKAFSKLRSSIAASIYDWRFRQAKTQAERERMLKEADFAYRQALAFCPFSPEAVFHYVKLLADTGRFDDAIVVAKTCFKLDPDNSVVENLVNQLINYKKQAVVPPPQQLDKLEKEFKDNPANTQVAFNLMGAYMQMQQPGKAMAVAKLLKH